MSRLNEEAENLSERRDIHGNNNHLEMYFEDEKNKTRNDIYLKCRTRVSVKRKRISCLHLQQKVEEEKKACLRFSFTFSKLGILLVVLLMFFTSFGSASTINATSSPYSTTTPASRGRWCQILLNEKKTKEVTETKLCSENYNSSCGFFTFTTCVFTRYKICVRIYNHTFLAYKTVMDCCPGWAKRGNDTCIELAHKSKRLPSIHELSVGTFAAICSASAFVTVIIFFIVKAVWKKKRKEKLAAESVHMEQLDSLDAPRPQQEVPLIPPQHVMSNPHSLVRPRSYNPDDHDLSAAAAAAPLATAAGPPPGFVVPAHAYTESDALCSKANPDLEADAVYTATAAAATTTAPVEDHQEQVGMKLLQKIPETEDMGATAAPADTITTTTTPPGSTENLGSPDNSDLQVELFIREDGDATDTNKTESQTQLQTQTLPENSKNDSQGLQLDPKV